MPFRATFDCLWCGASHSTRGPDDLEGWAQLCANCVGAAGDDGFRRFRLRQGLLERSAAARAAPGEPAPSRADESRPSSRPDLDAAMVDYYQARAPEYDDWYRRRGRYSHGPIHDAAWDAELDAAGTWLDGLPFAGEIVELAAGTGWWSPLLASRGELSLYDTSAAALELARERLVAHRLRAHIHVRDAWAEPDRQVDALFAGFWISHVPDDRLPTFLELAARWLKPAGLLAVIDSLDDPASGATDHPTPHDGLSIRRLDDGREFTVVKVHRTPAELAGRLSAAGFRDVSVRSTGRFFVLASARAG